MPPRTRRQAASVSSSATGTPARSALFSKTASTVGTPATSDGEESVSKRTAIKAGKKRAAENDEEEDVKPAKRRIIQQTAYVEISMKKVTKDKGKGKAPPPPDSDDEIVPDSEGLEFDDNANDSIQEASDSDSEFVAEELDTEDDEEMFQTAIRESIQYVGGASSSKVPNLDSPAARAAAAAERRLAKVNEMAWSEDDSEEDEPLVKGKGKGKGSKGKGKTAATRMTPAERRRETRRKAREAKNATRSEEHKLMRELGRRLTYAEKSTIQLHRFHPELRNAWGDLEAAVEIIEPKKAEQPSGLKVRLLPFQEESLYWMRKQEFGPYAGGLLADEMGMGKTIQMIALMVSGSAKPNLVIAPTVAIMQWRNEIDAHTESMQVLVWHGNTRINDPKELQKYDVVLTTYAVLESCFRKQQSGFKRKGAIIKEKSPLHAVEWNRIVLDEAHNIKERSTNTAKAAFELHAKFRWCLSGTPLQNRVGELYSLVRFLGCDPFSHYFCKKCDCKSLHWRFSDKRTCDDCGHSPMMHTCYWNNEILTPIQKNAMLGPGKIAFKKLRILLDRIMLRRTKVQRADDLGLPPRMVIVRRDYFSPEEKELYLSLFSDAKRQFSTYLDAGTLLNNYSNVFSLLTRMRQMACHPDLVIRSKLNAGAFVPEDAEATVCRLCNDIAEDAIQAKCKHIFDRECIKQYLNTSIEAMPACPVCHLALTIDLEAPALELEQPAAARQGILGRLNIDSWRSSSKIEALVEELSNLRRQDSTTKSIVFSQFVNFLDLIAFRLQRAGFVVCRLEGTMSPQARDATIQHFMNNVHVTVFLVSLKAGGVALNLTEASRVYLMDSWWNPAVEFQAMDRIHRLGQHRPVQAIKIVIEDSIESRIVQLQEKKSAMVDATLSTDDSAMGRLTPEDLSFLFRLAHPPTQL
ncbi:hypothetical protein BV25DRAFT_1896248 [Artomyces pyxidatus]|uniref:Uncharacterized protein n=1 Tax=Artomyces pyxidatus TaxID=48021 RepID=A0ACB8TLH8_9AGAM|nr:hypothetical protein BV25DRAFT_1896248 [Artomyces pyxidatus]